MLRRLKCEIYEKMQKRSIKLKKYVDNPSRKKNASAGRIPKMKKLYILMAGLILASAMMLVNNPPIFSKFSEVSEVYCTDGSFDGGKLYAAFSVVNGKCGESSRLDKKNFSLEECIKYFGAEIGGFHTYRYYDGNTLLRSWICIPLTVGIYDRAEGTVDALCSPLLWQDDGLLTEQGSSTFWDRSTLYALRGIYAAGMSDIATGKLHQYSERRLLGDHVPYAIEAWPEGSQRHLSAESGLYCRIITEGMFGIRPAGFDSFTLTPSMPSGWDKMSLRKIKAFGTDFDITVTRTGKDKIEIKIDFPDGSKTYSIKSGDSIHVKF